MDTDQIQRIRIKEANINVYRNAKPLPAEWGMQGGQLPPPPAKIKLLTLKDFFCKIYTPAEMWIRICSPL